jgi:hypothetical protein
MPETRTYVYVGRRQVNAAVRVQRRERQRLLVARADTSRRQRARAHHAYAEELRQAWTAVMAVEGEARRRCDVVVTEDESHTHR